MTRPIASSFPSTQWDPESGIVFSSREGFVWASWPGTEAAIKLGRDRVVVEIMQDFLKQDALGRRLNTPGPESD